MEGFQALLFNLKIVKSTGSRWIHHGISRGLTNGPLWIHGYGLKKVPGGLTAAFRESAVELTISGRVTYCNPSRGY